MIATVPSLPTVQVRADAQALEAVVESAILDEGIFARLLHCEKRRTAVSGRRSALVVIDCSPLIPVLRASISPLVRQLANTVRMTDSIGWYRNDSHIGILFAELGTSAEEAVQDILLDKVARVIREHLPPQEARQVHLSIHPLSSEAAKSLTDTGGGASSGSGFELLNEELFLKALHTEQRRTERSGRRFVLAVIDVAELLTAGCTATRSTVVDALANSVRATDFAGWYRKEHSAGIIFTEIGEDQGQAVAGALLAKFSAALASVLTIEQINHLSLSFYVFPGDWDTDRQSARSNEILYSDGVPRKKTELRLKRVIDIAGSLAGLVVLSPVFAVIAAGVKLSSKGPVIFRQERVGQYGKRFTFYKFRSMKHGNDDSEHRKFVTKLIEKGESSDGALKIEKDSRVTRIGAFLRKTSLDELPQLVNVLKGEMSLVGPRPPISYEVKNYNLWHRRRLLAAKPGITGLWQVEGRSRVAFNDMVRLDLRYATNWSLGLDIRILLQTPRAVISGEGAR